MLPHNTTGSNDTALGFNALLSNTAGDDNEASGVQALLQKSSGNYNSASGAQTSQNNTPASIIPRSDLINALAANATGSPDTAADARNCRKTLGQKNTAFALDAMFSNMTGSN